MMNYFTRKLTFSLLLSIMALPALAQDELQNDDARRAYRAANEALNKGDYNNAIVLYTQAIRMAPDNVMLRRDLAYTYFLSGNKEKAKEVIDPVINSDYADEQAYQVSSAIENSLGNTAKAERVINAGLKRFPQSGVLYNAKGNLAVGSSKTGNKNAIAAWQQGIASDPTYPANYYNAARYYNATDNPVWTILYSETYVNLDPNSAKTVEMKKMLLNAYQMLFASGDIAELPSFNSDSRSGRSAAAGSFTKAYESVMGKNGSVVIAGFTAETLTMLRTRFILDWGNSYADKYFSTLFAYHDKLLRSGNFDCYNQWLFGATENSQGFTIWLKANAKEYTRFEQWRDENPYMPSISDPKP